jgi:hypothetical protein
MIVNPMFAEEDGFLATDVEEARGQPYTSSDSSNSNSSNSNSNSSKSTSKMYRRATISIICLAVALTLLLAFDLGAALLGLSSIRLEHLEINLHPKLSAERDLEVNVYSKDVRSSYFFTTDVANLACAISYSKGTQGSSSYLTTLTQLPQSPSLPTVNNENNVNDDDEGRRRYDAILHKSDFESMRGHLWNASHASASDPKEYSFDFDCSTDVLVRLRTHHAAAFTIPLLSRQSWRISVKDDAITMQLGPFTRSSPRHSR